MIQWTKFETFLLLGFIEELGQGAGAPGAPVDQDQGDHQEPAQYDLGQVLGPLESLLPGLLGGGLGPQRGGGGLHFSPGPGVHAPMFAASRGPSNIRISARAGPGQQPGNLGMDQAALENALQVSLG